MNQSQLIKLGRWLTLLGYFSLLFGLFAWHLLIEPPAKHLISIIIFFQLGPLMLPLFGLLNGKLYTHAWSMYLAIFYFVIGVWYAGHDEDLMIGLYVIFTSLVFFTGTVVYTRYMGKQLKATSSSSD
ncbi:MAG: DUF2069 domain-containing protein [Gammaproteobacteria bacterium]|nr:DUF2069 domain-containing protein [Gammaproteobacteria bacterium]MBT8132970.1 DUF2069 domain-containing protein [Gammaproteobacteria bacterium]NNJ49913.1 DUF2069 domain-containing protein [Gammaproteobacteria bacterium]